MKTVTLKRFGVLSVGVISGILSAAMVLITVLVAAPFFAMLPLRGENLCPVGWMSGFFIILAPIFYGVWGFICGVISAALYNLFARRVGGIKVELEQETPTEGNA
ncbi:hypothetical protein ACFLTY_05345 [Chloroflexota bacterium]